MSASTPKPPSSGIAAAPLDIEPTTGSARPVVSTTILSGGFSTISFALPNSPINEQQTQPPPELGVRTIAFDYFRRWRSREFIHQRQSSQLRGENVTGKLFCCRAPVISVMSVSIVKNDETRMTNARKMAKSKWLGASSARLCHSCFVIHFIFLPSADFILSHFNRRDRKTARFPPVIAAITSSYPVAAPILRAGLPRMRAVRSR